MIKLKYNPHGYSENFFIVNKFERFEKSPFNLNKFNFLQQKIKKPFGIFYEIVTGIPYLKGDN